MTDPAELRADIEWQRQMAATTPELRAGALHVALRAFQAALATEGAEVNDYMAICTLLSDALDEYGEDLDAGLSPIQ